MGEKRNAKRGGQAKLNLKDTDTMVSVAKRRRVVADIRSECKRREVVDQAMQARADKAVKSAMPMTVFGELDVIDTAPPFPLNPTHALIFVGGFAGCILCGGIAGFQPSKLLESDCRRHLPKGSQGPIRKLVKGQLPHVQRENDGRQWPTCEINPKVYRLVTQRDRRVGVQADEISYERGDYIVSFQTMATG